MEAFWIRSARIWGVLALTALAVWLGMVVFYAPVEKVQGVVQKIFYAHVPNSLPAYLGFGLTALGGLLFLITRRESYDRLAQAGAEVGVVFCTLIVVTGPIWAKPVWGHWWVWDLRLTATLVLWFIYLAYLFLRAFAYGSDATKTFASVYGIAGIIAVPFVKFAVELAKGQTMHPDDPAKAGLPAEMQFTLMAGFIAYLLVFAYFLSRRLEIAKLEADLQERLDP